MTPEQFHDYQHEAVHALMDLNAKLKDEFRLGAWPRWDYDLDEATLTFSEKGKPRVRAGIQVVGSVSLRTNTWLWAWANSSVPDGACSCLAAVKAFGEEEAVAVLTTDQCAADEALGWELTAVVAKLAGAKGAYRCPTGSGDLFVIFTDIAFVQ